MRDSYEITPNVWPYLHNLGYSRLGILSSRAHVFGSGLIDKSTIYCFPITKSMYNYSIAMITRKEFVLLPQINQIIQNIIEVGLIRQWEQECKINPKARLRTQKLSFKEDSNEGFVSEIKATLFSPMVIGYCLAVIGFVTERVVKFYNDRYRCQNWFWRFSDSLLTPKKKAFFINR